MAYDPEKHHRQSIRLKGYDYSQAGAYSVTVCTHDRAGLFGDVADGMMVLNDAGRIVQTTWDGLPEHYPGVGLDVFVVMPNHVHGIIVLDDPVGAGLKPAPTDVDGASFKRHGLSEIIRGFKTFSARRINASRNTSGLPVWQRNYYEHVVRNEESLNRIRQYIAENPLQWVMDRENPVGAGFKPAPTRDEPWCI